MLRLTRTLKQGIVISLLGFLTACGGPVILKDPHGAKVNRVALVTVYANRGVSKMEQGGSLAALSAVASLVKSSNDNDKDFGGTTLTNYAIETFEKEFAKVPKWQVIPASRVFASPAYKTFVDKVPSLYYNDVEKGLAKVNFATGDKTVYLPGEGRDKRSINALSELAKQLDADAVAVLQMDMKYDLSTGVGSTGTAVAKVGLSMVMVNKDGKIVMDTPSVSDKNSQTPYRVASNNSVPMIAGAIMFDDKSAAMFQDSIQQGLIRMRENVNKDLDFFAKK